MVSEAKSASRQPAVRRIYLDYEDGSCDEISLLQSGEMTVYDLCRKRAGGEMRSLGAHTSGAIAAILFHTVTTTERIEYSFRDPTIRAVLERLFGNPSPGGEKESGTHDGST